jgi:hypothetical protein
MSKPESMKTKPLTDKHHRNNAVGMRISSEVLESVCKKMIKIILFCLPHATKGTIYSIGPIPDLLVLRIASGHRNEQSEEIRWDMTSRSDYDFPGKVWQDYRDRPGGILEAMAWCVEAQKSWTADDPENNSRSVRKQLEGKGGEDHHHMEPVLVDKTDLWDVMPPVDAYPEDSQGKPIWQDSRYATVGVIKIHFLPETIKRGDRSTRTIKELSRSLGTEMLSLHAKEIALEKEKRLVGERQDVCNTLAHEFRNLVTRMGLAYRAINNEIDYLRESWESLVQQHLPEQSSKSAILRQLNEILRDVAVESNCTNLSKRISQVTQYQHQLLESCLLPRQNEMWFWHKIKPLWMYILSNNDFDTAMKGTIEDLLGRLQQSFYRGLDKTVRKRIDIIADDLKDKWVELAYREIDKNMNGMIEEYIELLDNLKLEIPRMRHSLRNFIYLKSLIELIPEIEGKLNHRLDLLKKT